jgi:hypothetical protein
MIAVVIVALVYFVRTSGAAVLVYLLPLALLVSPIFWFVYKWARRSWTLGLAIENARVILPHTLGRLIRRRQPEFRVPPVEGIQASSTTLMETDEDRIVEISFSGRYPPGSFGNEHADRMIELAKTIIEREKPGAVLFNLHDLSYVWGDRICGLAMTIFDRDHEAFLPGCVYAEGRTASALEGLFTKGWLFELAGMRLFRDRANAESYLKECLSNYVVKQELRRAIAYFIGRQRLVAQAMLDLGLNLDEIGRCGAMGWAGRISQRGIWKDESGCEWRYYLHGAGCLLRSLRTDEPINWDCPNVDAFDDYFFMQHLEWQLRSSDTKSQLTQTKALHEGQKNNSVSGVLDEMKGEGLIREHPTLMGLKYLPAD